MNFKYTYYFKMICVFGIFFSLGCHTIIKRENKILIFAKRSREAVASKNNRSSMKYYWKGKLYRDTNSFDARYSKELNYFLIYIDKLDPKNWESYSIEDFGYLDTLNFDDNLRQKVYIDKVDFNLLSQEN